MPRTFFLSPDPQPNRPFTVTFTIEGTDAEGKPLAVLGDDYDIICIPDGKILFDEHVRQVTSVNEAANHSAEIIFVARDGFTGPGEFRIVCSKLSDPRIREEKVVHVSAANPALTLAPTTPSTPTVVAALPVITTGTPVAIPGIPLIGVPTPTPTAAPAATPVATPRTPAARAATVAVPPPTVLAKKTSMLDHPIFWIAGLVLVLCSIVTIVTFGSNKPNEAAAVKSDVHQASDATRTTDASITTDKSDAAIAEDATSIPVANDSVQAPTAEPKTPPTTKRNSTSPRRRTAPEEPREWKVDLNN